MFPKEKLSYHLKEFSPYFSLNFTLNSEYDSIKSQIYVNLILINPIKMLYIIRYTYLQYIKKLTYPGVKV